MRNIFLVIWLICECFTTWRWRKYEAYFFSLDDFLASDLVAGALVYLSDLRTFIIVFKSISLFSETLDGLSPCTYFSTLEIFLIFMTFLILEITYHVSNSLWTQSENTSKNFSLVTPTEKILENEHLFLVKNVHVYRCRKQVNEQYCFPWGSWFSWPFGYRT